jgi:hypothetical protein
VVEFGVFTAAEIIAKTAANLAEDNQREGRKPRWEWIIDDDVLDERAIINWWAGYNVENATFNTFKKNCSTTTVRALRAGGSDKFVSIGWKAAIKGKYYGWEPTSIVGDMGSMEKNGAATQVNSETIKISPCRIPKGYASMALTK